MVAANDTGQAPERVRRYAEVRRCTAAGVCGAGALAVRCHPLIDVLTSLGQTVRMSTQTSTPYLLRRVAVRAGVGVWRHRGGVLFATLAAAALGGYAAMTWSGSLPVSFAQSPSIGPGTDCADTAMAAVADKSPAAVQRAYQCMAPAFQQRVSEQAFVQQMQTQSLPNVNKLARVGDYRTAAGGSMVYYAVDASGQSVGYIVYLGSDGKVLRIE
jgi:hypothetical protein